METLGDAINKKMGKSLLCFLKLVDPEKKFEMNATLIEAWNRLTLVEQQKLYLYLLYRKWRGLDIYGEPYYIIRNCHPVPFNWNQHSLGKTLIQERKVIIAKYNGSFGTYTRDEARLYEMTEKQWYR